jgi:CheY-like chemotaxis protein
VTTPNLVVVPGHDERVRVLIVDDSDDQRHLLRRYFERAGCDVRDAPSAEAAIDAYGIVTPDLAVIDLILPGMDGWALAVRLGADNPECIIAITSVLDTEDYPEGHACLPKPVTGAHVRKMLHDFVPKWNAA